jgi:hypothetical protein
MPVDPFGVAIGLGGILLAFKGVVDTINLFDLILAADNGSKHLALKYYIERHRLRIWGDEFKAADEVNSPLLGQPKATRILIAGILAEIRATHDLSEKYLPRYQMTSPTIPDSHFEESSLDIDDKVVAAMKVTRDERPTKHRVLWATRDKGKFTEIIKRLQSLNNDLYAVLPTDNTHALATALSSYLLPKLQDQMSLLALQQIDTTNDPLLVLAARIKQLNDAPESETAQQATWLQYGTSFKTIRANIGKVREEGTLDSAGSLGERSWIEWKTVKTDLNAVNAKVSSQRIETLAVLLSTASAADFRIPTCSGLLEDLEYKARAGGPSRRLGFVFRFPEEAAPSSQLITLRELLLREDQSPLLSDRFALAYKLASALSLFHASRWLHKGFRSDNIIFFTSKDGSPIISEPYITGFEYSRPEGQASIDVITTGNAELDLYYHPDVGVQGFGKFGKLRDIYSLSVVLFEVALWRPMKEIIVEDDQIQLEGMNLSQIRALMLDAVPMLGSYVGPAYRDAVRVFLTGDFNVPADDDNTELPRAFFSDVLKKLSYCRA